MIVIIDYGMGNLRSVEKAFLSVGADVRVSARPDDVRRAEKIVLPGVGAFRDAMRGLEKRKLIEPVLDGIREGKPYLGLCLGLQLLFEESEEFGKHNGLGVFHGRVKRFRGTLKIPHMGWNQAEFATLKSKNGASRILKGIPDKSYFYFVHSYYVKPEESGVTAARTRYGIRFTSIAARENVFACQFHPEKSQTAGLRLLKNFSECAPC